MGSSQQGIEERITERLQALAPGAFASALLVLAENVVAADNFTIGDDVYEIEIVNTDSTDNTAGGLWNNTTSPLIVDLSPAAYDNLRPTLAVGKLIRIENEILRLAKINGNKYEFHRGDSGTTAAAHANGVDIFRGDGVTAGRIAVGLVTTLTPAAAQAAIVDVVNSGWGSEKFIRCFARSAALTMFYYTKPGAFTTACAEAFNGATNLIDANFAGGAPTGVTKYVRVSRVPTTIEVSAGVVNIALPFNPVAAFVEVRVTASNAVKAWDGDNALVAASPPAPAYVTVNNDGAVDFDANDTIEVIAFG